MSEISLVEERSTKIKKELLKKNYIDAIVLALMDYPVFLKDPNAKAKNLEIVFRAFSSPSERDFESIIKHLLELNEKNYTDRMMKYVYKGLSQPNYSNVFLKWHAHCVTAFGSGSIIRTMTDHNTF